MRIGLLTGGGDCPGLNAAIRGIVKRAAAEGDHQVIGFRHGWKGVRDGDIWPLTPRDTRDKLPLGGTMLGTARFHPDREDGSLEQCMETLEAERIDAVICIGGDGTLQAANLVAESGIKVIGIPKTIDNDVALTERSIGFDTAVTIATEAIDRVHTTAESHDRVMVVEVMGRHNGWIAATAGIAGGAEVILTPEEPFDIEAVTRYLKHRHKAYSTFSLVVVAEGAQAAEGTAFEYTKQLGRYGEIIAGSVGAAVAGQIQERTGFDTRLTVLGHVQRGGMPTPYDRVLASRFGVAAVDALDRGESQQMTALQNGQIVLVPLADIAGKVQEVPADLLRVARLLR